ncbi:hypothetical protein H4R99_006124, partial [Coemansia sp. RSA 1722]
SLLSPILSRRTATRMCCLMPTMTTTMTASTAMRVMTPRRSALAPPPDTPEPAVGRGHPTTLSWALSIPT